MTVLRTVVLALVVLMPASALAEDEWVVRDAAGNVPEAVARLTAAIEAGGAKVVAALDHQANAASAGLDMPAATVVIFGNPKLGTPLMQENIRMAIDLPQRILVWDENGTTKVGYVEPGEIAERYGIEDAAVAKMAKALDLLSAKAASR